MNDDGFTEEQRQYLQGFVAGADLARSCLWPSHVWPDPRPQRGLAVAHRDPAAIEPPGAGIPSIRGTEPAPRGGEETLPRGGGEAAEVSARPLG